MAKRISAVIVMTILSVAALEFLVTLFIPVYIGPEDYFDDFIVSDPEIGYTMKPNFHGNYHQDYDMVFNANSYGFRDRNFGPRKAGVFRILIMGDSMTFGTGVSAEDAWPKLLEGSLARRGMKAETLNTGIPGYSTIHYERVVQRMLPIYKPDMVIVMTFSNDVGGDLATNAGVYPALNSQKGRWRVWLKRHSNLAKRLWVLYATHTTRKFSYADASIAAYASDDRSVQAYKLFDRAITDIKDQTDHYKVRFVLTMAEPVLASDQFSQHVVALAAREGISFVDVLKGKLEPPDFINTTSAGHWSPKGTHVVAENLAEYIVTQGLAK